MSKKLMIIANVNQFGYSAGHYYYCKYLREYFDIIYICRDLGLKKIEMNGVNVLYNIPNKNKVIKLYSFIITVLKQCYNLKPDIVFIVYFKACFLIPLLYKSGNCLLDIRTGSLIQNSFFRFLFNYSTYFQSLFFKKVIILSESLRSVLGISKKKSLILPLGADVFYNGKHTYNNLNLLYVGTLNGRRIFETIEGIAIFLQKRPDLKDKICYTVVGFGDDSEVNKIKESIIRNNLETIVSYAGRKTYEELPMYFAKANIGVCYIPEEQFYEIQPSTKIFEYSLSGLITIATNTYENRLLIKEDNGILCEDNADSFCESLELLSSKINKYEENKIRNSLGTYTWENIVKNNLFPFVNNSCE